MTGPARIYVRQSLDHEEGIDRQLARCRALAKARGLRVVGTYQDNFTSASDERGPGTAWHGMLGELEPGDLVLAVDVDRVLRSIRDLLAITDRGALLLTVDGEIDLSSADGEFRATMLAGIARFETRRKVERQKRANEARVANGRPVSGRRRYGYEVGNMTLRPDEAQRVRWLFEQVRDGASLRSLAMKMAETDSSRKWTPKLLRLLLLNPSYAGMVVRYGEAFPSPLVEPAVSAELAEEVHAILTNPARITTTGPAFKHLLSGIARCGTCEAPMVFTRAYRCSASTSHPTIIKATLDARVRKAVVERILQGDLPRPSTRSSAGRTRTLRADLAELGKRRQRIADLYEADAITKAEMQTRLRPIVADEQKANDELQRLVNASALDRMLEGVIEPLRLMDGKRHRLDEAPPSARELGQRFDAMTLEHRRELVRALVTVKVFPGRDPARVKIAKVGAAEQNAA